MKSTLPKNNIISNVMQGKFLFLLILAGVFGASFAVLYTFGLVPEGFKVAENTIATQELPNDNSPQDEIEQGYTRPTHVTIPAIGVDSVITLPNTQNVQVLDEFLKQGAVHYPGSGSVESGNIFLFGHSTNWAVVNNQAYKTFNDLDKLQKGDEIRLEADGKTYVYSVDTVSLVDENSAFVDLSSSGRKLTISTCNTFGKKQERFVVEAYFDRVEG